MTRVRAAVLDDLPAVLALVNREIDEGVAHFATEPLTLDQVRAEWDRDAERYPTLVAERDGCVLGFAKAGPWKTRGAYAWTVELGVYVHPDAQGQGIGKALYAALFPELERRGFRTVLAGIALPNPNSIRLHEQLGMTRVGVLPGVGWKHGAWHDVGYWAIQLGEGPPEAPCTKAGSG